MRPSLGRTSAVVALGVLASVATASGECAWVLWSRVQRLDSTTQGEWTIGGDAAEVFTSYSKCRARIARITGVIEEGSLADWVLWLRSSGPYDPARNASASDVIGPHRIPGGVAIRSSLYYTLLKCLPDTIDPRRPKARP